jgi:hypothetical protein
MITALQLIKEEIKNARETFEGTMADVGEAQVNLDPGGKAMPLGAAYAHLIFSEDSIIHKMLQGLPALSDSTWKDKTGASQPMPAMDENWSANNEKWVKSVKIDLKQMRDYAKAVFADTDDYVKTLKETDLEKEIDLGNWGKKTVAFLLYEYIIAHTNNLSGELSAIKGVHGNKGYPF